MLITYESTLPRHIPTSEDVVNCDTDLPEMSPTLLRLANLRLIYARDAAANKKHMFFPTLAVEAKNRNICGNASVMISI